MQRVERLARFDVGGTWPTLPEFRLVAEAGSSLSVSRPAEGRHITVDYEFAGGEAVQPKVSYEVDVAALDADDAGLGDTVAVVDTSRNPEWRLKARIVRRVRTFGDSVVARVTIGTVQPVDYASVSSLAADVAALQSDVKLNPRAKRAPRGQPASRARKVYRARRAIREPRARRDRRVLPATTARTRPLPVQPQRSTLLPARLP